MARFADSPSVQIRSDFLGMIGGDTLVNPERITQHTFLVCPRTQILAQGGLNCHLRCFRKVRTFFSL